MVGFPISLNQFNVLQDSEYAMSQSQVQEEDRLIDPKSTRQQRFQASRRAEEQGILLSDGVLNTLPQYRDEQGILSTGEIEELVSSRNQPAFLIILYLPHPQTFWIHGLLVILYWKLVIMMMQCIIVM